MNPGALVICNFLITILITSKSVGQILPDTTIYLKNALQSAEEKYHLLQAKRFEADAAVKNVEVIQYSKRPSIDASYHVNLATANNLTGMFYPSGILPISGPPSANNQYGPATGSTASVFLNWQAGTFGQRDAQINLSILEAKGKKSEWQQSLFMHKINIISNYLNVVLNIEKIKLIEQNVNRVTINLDQSRVLARNGIKPGVDTILFLSELSKATIELLTARQELVLAQLSLSQLIGIDALSFPADTAFLVRLPQRLIPADIKIENNPLVQFSQSQADIQHSKEQLLKKSYLPKLNVWGIGFVRGSGFNPNGSTNTFDGLVFNRVNYGVGAQLIYPIMKYGEMQKQLAQQNLLSKAAIESVEENKSILTLQHRMADAAFNNSIAIARESLQQLYSSQSAFNAMQTRYNTGLVNFADLIQTQYNLFKAELDNKTTYWNAWKALLLQTAVAGDENLFLNAIR